MRDMFDYHGTSKALFSNKKYVGGITDEIFNVIEPFDYEDDVILINWNYLSPVVIEDTTFRRYSIKAPVFNCIFRNCKFVSIWTNSSAAHVIFENCYFENVNMDTICTQRFVNCKFINCCIPSYIFMNDNFENCEAIDLLYADDSFMF